MNITNHLSNIKRKAEDLNREYEGRIEAYLEELGKVSVELDNLSQRWAGSWTQHYDVYFRPDTDKREYDNLSFVQVKHIVESASGVSTSEIWHQTERMLLKTQRFHEEVIAELSVIKNRDEFAEQKKLLEKLESFKWGIVPSKVIQMKRPSNLIMSVSEAEEMYSKGLKTPPHIAYGATLLAKGSELKAIQDYFRLLHRIFREIQLSEQLGVRPSKEASTTEDVLKPLLNNFHRAARQMANRYSNRSTLDINDEYDVQDLLHVFLKLYFNDVRPEDYSPSYAGRNTRVDFLLKKEKVIIEVKKTREGLKDKQIGDELLQDIARYKNHPDCDILYCFVYDPDNFISNPRGLEEDLMGESSESFSVIVMIRP